MPKIVWDAAGQRTYETGVDHGVLYTHTESAKYGSAVPWNGLTAVNQQPSGAEPTPIYADNIKYLNLTSVEEFAATIEAYTYPDEFAKCDGSFMLPAADGLAAPFSGITIGQQRREEFGFAYRTLKGNDEKYNDYGYIIHVIWGAQAAPSERSHATVNDSPEAVTFSWSITTTAQTVETIEGVKPTALMEFDSTLLPADFMTALEETLYGNDTDDGRLPTPDELIELYNTTAGTDAGA